MRRVTLDYRGSTIHASCNPDTQEVKFDGKAVTGKMWLTSPGRRYVEIIKRGRKYYLETAA